MSYIEKCVWFSGGLEVSFSIWTFFEFFYFVFKSFVKVELRYVSTINLFTIAENFTEK